MVVIVKLFGEVIDKDFYTTNRIKELQTIAGITIERVER